MLIDGDADLNITDRKGCTPLHVACTSVSTNRMREGSLEVMRVLILAGADTQVRDSQGRLPVDLLRSDDEESRAIYEEAVVEMDSRALRPVLK
jgi:hypothetical protein